MLAAHLLEVRHSTKIDHRLFSFFSLSSERYDRPFADQTYPFTPGVCAMNLSTCDFSLHLLLRLFLLVPVFSLSFSCVSQNQMPASQEIIQDSSKASGTDSDKARALNLIMAETRKNGGVTFDVKSLRKVEVGESAYAVSLQGGVILAADASDAEFETALQKMLESYTDDFWRRGYLLGTWMDHQAKQLTIDRTVLFHFHGDDRAEALAQALALGKNEKQKAIFDLSQGETIAVH